MNALVTGGCSGLGMEFTKELLSRGYKVYALYHKSVDNAYELENKYDNLRCIKCDIRKENEVDNVLFNIDELDLVINNAGISKDNDISDKTAKEFLSVLETNVVGTFLVSKYSKNILKKDGAIINISSNNSLDNYNPISMDYDASKAGVNMLTKDFAKLLDCKVLAYAPGWINTDSIMEMNPEFLYQEMKSVNQEKLIDKASLVKYILDDYKTRETGSIIEVKEV